MSTIFVITSGTYSEYSIHSVWSEEEKANSVCALLNSGNSRGYEVEEYPLNEFLNPHTIVGYVGEYDMAKYGYPVDVSNIEIVEAVIPVESHRDYRAGYITWLRAIKVEADTIEAVHKVVFDLAAETHAKALGLDVDAYITVSSEELEQLEATP